jgi:hypothetical protein
VNLVGRGIAFDHDPHATALEVLPGLKLNTIDVLTLKHSLQPLFSRCVQGRIFNRSITTIAELTVIALPAKWTVDPNHCADVIRVVWDRGRRHVHQD